MEEQPEQQMVCSCCNEPVGDVDMHALRTGHTAFRFLNSATYGV